ncbi:MAG: hypothetical protein MI743_03850 [Sneathiellales bacterium]|nr:hypothetical protein [Sneathiellales bacterium]
MEIVRSTYVPVKALHLPVPPPEEQNGYAERLEQEQSRQSKAALSVDSQSNSGIHSRHRQEAVRDPDIERKGSTALTNREPAPRPSTKEGLAVLPSGGGSAAFIAQQLSQEAATLAGHLESTIHDSASQAYKNTLGLTATIMGLQGFREKFV